MIIEVKAYEVSCDVVGCKHRRLVGAKPSARTAVLGRIVDLCDEHFRSLAGTSDARKWVEENLRKEGSGG